jgi:hypothetical protein
MDAQLLNSASVNWNMGKPQTREGCIEASEAGRQGEGVGDNALRRRNSRPLAGKLQRLCETIGRKER